MTVSKNKVEVVILDDEENVEKAIVSRLPVPMRKNSKAIKPEDIAPMVKELGLRAAAVRSSAKRDPKLLPLDTADLFIVDYDLVRAQNEDYLTGETVAYLARCYSNCGVIVALNQFHRQSTFDLTLRPQLDSFADLNIAADDLKNSGLWKHAPWSGYRPWSWPVIPELIDLLEKRIADVAKADSADRVLEFLGFPASAIERLPTASLELLGSQESKVERATLGDIIRSSTLGLRGREATDRKPRPDQDARIVAARLSAWLNFVLVSQDVLVDAPHLAQRCPSLIGGKLTASAIGNTCKLGSNQKAFKAASLTKARFAKSHWFDRPVWFWTEIERERLTSELQDPWNSVDDRLVFCEDSSQFKARTSSKAFQSDLISPYRTRFVSRVAGIDYQPAHRLALA
ncbi:hypothetical protein I6F09_17175 [Bradyrhizobium sp. IC3195]|uniref:hypothetical protein n=1 Tax=Bradyrhizobium sp. IC3195 TaxID=2793804 RepID=UPI001CD775B0|nr:hypothetical protein [Bradyrhizobium sp. IC3195]MCA1469629.1 hypothetical protein [Bradyrhizobium sp. IC3195]